MLLLQGNIAFTQNKEFGCVFKTKTARYSGTCFKHQSGIVVSTCAGKPISCYYDGNDYKTTDGCYLGDDLTIKVSLGERETDSIIYQPCK